MNEASGDYLGDLKLAEILAKSGTFKQEENEEEPSREDMLGEAWVRDAEAVGLIEGSQAKRGKIKPLKLLKQVEKKWIQMAENPSAAVLPKLSSDEESEKKGTKVGLAQAEDYADLMEEPVYYNTQIDEQKKEEPAINLEVMLGEQGGETEIIEETIDDSVQLEEDEEQIHPETSAVETVGPEMSLNEVVVPLEQNKISEESVKIARRDDWVEEARLAKREWAEKRQQEREEYEEWIKKQQEAPRILGQDETWKMWAGTVTADPAEHIAVDSDTQNGEVEPEEVAVDLEVKPREREEEIETETKESPLEASTLTEFYQRMDSPLNDDATLQRVLNAFDRYLDDPSYFYEYVQTEGVQQKENVSVDEQARERLEKIIFASWRENVVSLDEVKARKVIDRLAQVFQNNLPEEGRENASKMLLRLSRYLANHEEITTQAELKQAAAAMSNPESRDLLESCIGLFGLEGVRSDNSWTYLSSERISLYQRLRPEVKHRFYLDTQVNQTHAAVADLVQALERHDLAYHLKYARKENDFSLDRTDTVVVYCATEQLTDYFQIWQELEAQQPEWLQKSGPLPTLVASVTPWLGYGAEVPIDMKGKSYSSWRADVIRESLEQALQEWASDHLEDTWEDVNLEEYLVDQCLEQVRGEIEKKTGATVTPEQHRAAIDAIVDAIETGSWQGFEVMNLSAGSEENGGEDEKAVMIYWGQLRSILQPIFTQKCKDNPEFFALVRMKIRENCEREGIDAEKFCFNEETKEEFARIDEQTASVEEESESVDDKTQSETTVEEQPVLTAAESGALATENLEKLTEEVTLKPDQTAENQAEQETLFGEQLRALVFMDKQLRHDLEKVGSSETVKTLPALRSMLEARAAALAHQVATGRQGGGVEADEQTIKEMIMPFFELDTREKRAQIQDLMGSNKLGGMIDSPNDFNKGRFDQLCEELMGLLTSFGVETTDVAQMKKLNNKRGKIKDWHAQIQAIWNGDDEQAGLQSQLKEFIDDKKRDMSLLAKMKEGNFGEQLRQTREAWQQVGTGAE